MKVNATQVGNAESKVIEDIIFELYKLNEEQLISSKKLAENLGMNVKICRAYLSVMRQKGFLKTSYAISEENKLQGSGYCLTKLGVKKVELIAELNNSTKIAEEELRKFEEKEFKKKKLIALFALLASTFAGVLLGLGLHNTFIDFLMRL